jgi:hypothetical protein
MATKSQSPVADLYKAARTIADKTAAVMREHGNVGDVRIPVLMQGTDLRVTIESGPTIAARNAIEHAQMQAADRPIKDDRGDALRQAMALIAHGIRRGSFVNVQDAEECIAALGRMEADL